MFNNKTYLPVGYTLFANAIYNFNEYWFVGFDKIIPVSWVLAEEYIFDENKFGVPARPQFQIRELGKCVFITTSKFSNDARSYQPKNETKIALIDGEKLTDLMIDFNLAVSTINTFEIKRLDNDYFEEE